MRRLLLLSFTTVFVLSFVLISCDKTKTKMEVVKDCTGVYLRDNSGKDYKVCNEFILESHAAGTKLEVRFDNLNQCFGLIEDPVCSDSHEFEGLIEITEIL